ncbi:MAG: hypothetical protein IPH44_41970 [Myxococcales bacterium]|nr:hypothetical protein [Myxococcales bacterium]MBK7193036.1 hypothetical protein [Myxococcales bacterium]MBP6843071.1 hypothetical protein [Kofleriaceae bacterium]
MSPRAALRSPLPFLILVVACGDSTTASPDAPAAIDAAIDAPVCEATGYPMPIRATSVDLGAPTHLTLDGQGARCEQIGRALLGATGRPVELAQLDAAGATVSCTHDDVLNREIVRVRAPSYGGLPLFGPVQDALVHVDATDTIVFLHADYLPVGATVAAACLDAPTVGAGVPGAAMSYQRFNLCVPGPTESYTIASDDVIEVGAEGFLVDGAGDLRRVRAVDVYLAPAHVTTAITNSDAFCCSGATTDHCIGQRLFVDVITGDVISQAPHCHTC